MSALRRQTEEMLNTRAVVVERANLEVNDAGWLPRPGRTAASCAREERENRDPDAPCHRRALRSCMASLSSATSASSSITIPRMPPQANVARPTLPA